MLKMLKKLLRCDWGYASICIAFIAAQVWLDMTMPDYMSMITVPIETPGSVMSEVWHEGGMMLLCALGSLAASCITTVFSARIGSNLASTLRGCMFKKVQTFSMEETVVFPRPA